MSNTVWVCYLAWRAWTFGVVFGPEVYELHVGPLVVGFDPEMWKFHVLTGDTE